MKLLFKLRNETKGALRYEEVAEDGETVLGISAGASVGTLYIRKTAYTKGIYPDTITVDIIAGDHGG